MTFDNQELVIIYKKFKLEKEKLDASIERGFTLVTKLNRENKNLQIAAKAKNIDDKNASKIRESVIYKTYETILNKLEPIVEIIIDSDKDVQNNLKNLL
jgi:hypothetical protein